MQQRSIVSSRLAENIAAVPDATRRRPSATRDALAKVVPFEPAAHPGLTERAQNSVAHVLLQCRGLDAAADALANALDNPVLVQDRFSRVIARSSSQEQSVDRLQPVLMTNETLPESSDLESARSRWLHSDRICHPVRLSSVLGNGGQGTTVVAPIVFDADTQGYVLVIESNRRLDPADFVTLEEAAVHFSFELLRLKTASEVETRLRGSFLDELLTADGPSLEALQMRGAAVGFDCTRRHRLMVVGVTRNAADLPTGADPLVTDKRLRERCQTLVQGVVARMAPGALVAGRSGGAIVVVPAPLTLAADKLGEFTTNVASAIKRELTWYLPEAAILIGIGCECRSVADYRVSYEEAQQALGFLADSGNKNEIVFFDSLGVCGLLLCQTNSARLLRFADGLLGQVVEYDRKRGSDLLHTLEVFLQHGGNLQRAADALSIHVNTARYRMEQIGRLCAVDMRDVDARFNLQMALKILKVVGKSAR